MRKLFAILILTIGLYLPAHAQWDCNCPDFQLTNAEFVNKEGMPLSVMLLLSPKVCDEEQFIFDMGIITVDGKTYSAEIDIQESYEEELFVNTLELITLHYKNGSTEASAAIADIVISNKITAFFAHYVESEKKMYILYNIPKKNWLGVQIITDELLEKG